MRGDQEEPTPEVQWIRKGGCLLFMRRNTRWREEWMRDRALLCDLLRQHPQASPQELARLTGRSGSPGEAMAQAAHRS
jgi:hypothetical protein